MSALAFALRIWRRDRTTRRGAALTTVAIGVATALMVMLAAVPGALQERADRIAWRGADPTNLVQFPPPGGRAADPETSRVVLSGTAYDVGGVGIQQVGIATRGPVAPAAGMPLVPRPGQVLVSPAVARMLRGPHADVVRSSLRGRVVGTLGPEALSGPDERVVVTGLRASAFDGVVGDLNNSAVVGRDGLRGADAHPDPFYVALVWIALSLLVLPTVALALQIARLLATRREERTAALQLVGADPGWTLRAAVAETAAAAAAGAVVGALIGVPVARLALVHVSFNGTTWYAGDLTTPPWLVLVAVLGLPGLSALGTALAQRRSTGPLGTILRHRPRPLRAWRLLLLPVAAGLMQWGLSSLDENGSVIPMLCALAAVVLTTSVVGPLAVSFLGRVARRFWRRPATLLAARRMLDEPRAVWRIASGPVLAAFVAATMLGAAPTLQDAVDADAGGWNGRHLTVALDGRSGGDVPAALERRLAATVPGDAPRVRLYPFGSSGDASPLTAAQARKADLVDLVVTTGRDPVRRDAVAAAIARTLPGAGATGADRSDPTLALVKAVFAGATGTLVLASLLAALATAVTSLGTVLDRRRTLAALRMAGTPVATLRRTMQREVALPTVIGVAASGGAGALFAAGLMRAAEVDPVRVVNAPLVLAMVLAIGLPLVAVRAAGTTIERVTAGGPAAE
ncbi:FtsX-like permease family protein [Patulibacter americanus]|uniref:FtsX-like permease family protein n=1 Tax=Patulibacter americanus TaxID=588672 RepID=UPI0003B3471D|nr:FtsX-like permease family protein [Patulibacter americanus]